MRAVRIFLTIFCALIAKPAGAVPVEITYSVSGSAGNWTYDFSFT